MINHYMSYLHDLSHIKMNHFLFKDTKILSLEIFKIIGNHSQCLHIVSIIYFKNYIRHTNISGSEVMLTFELLVMNKWNCGKPKSPRLSTCNKQLQIKEDNSWHVMHYFLGNIKRSLHKINLLFEVVPPSNHNHVKNQVPFTIIYLRINLPKFVLFSKKNVHSGINLLLHLLMIDT